MHGTIGDTLEELGRLCKTSLDVEIDYDAWPGEPMVRYYPNGDGYPGSDPGCELMGVTVTEWYVGDTSSERCERKWIWAALDAIALAYVEKRFGTIYADLCLEDASNQTDPYF